MSTGKWGVRQDLFRRIEYGVGRFGAQFFHRAITVGHRPGGEAIDLAADNVILAVPDDHGVLGCKVFDGKDMPHQRGFIGEVTVELAAVGCLEVLSQAEVFKNLLGKDPGFGRGQKEAVPLPAKCCQGFRYSRIDPILKKADGAEPLAIQFDRLFQQLRIARIQETTERLAERWTDAPVQTFTLRRLMAEFGQGVLDASGDAGFRIGQGAVQIEKNGGGLHVNGEWKRSEWR